MRRLLRLAPALTAVGFTLGSIEHALGFALASLDVLASPPGYPPWRHAVMSGVDATIVTFAIRRPAALIFPLTLFLAEQVVTNGRWVVGEWRDNGTVHAYLIAMLVFETAATILAAVNRGWPVLGQDMAHGPPSH